MKREGSWTDRPTEEDRLGFRDYLNPLVKVIWKADTPITIGIFGTWGSGKTMNIGTDTGFFVELLRGNSSAAEVRENLIHGEDQGVCSALTLSEIERLGLKGSITREAASSLLEAIPAVCRMAWIEARKIVADAAGLSHGLGLPAVDALILAGFVQTGVEIIYTTDKHMEGYKAKDVRTVNLANGMKNPKWMTFSLSNSLLPDGL